MCKVGGMTKLNINYYKAHRYAQEFITNRYKKEAVMSGSNELLTIGMGSAKLGQDTATFSLPAGWTCPGARECMARADRETGKVVRGKHSKFTCYAASMEWRSSVRESRARNERLLKGCDGTPEMVALIEASLLNKGIISKAARVRVHVSGDFFSAEYFRAWCQVAVNHPDKVFYAYTKSLKIWVENRELVPPNFKLVASKGGVWDGLIQTHGLRYAEVVFSRAQAEALGLAIEEAQDELAYGSDSSFALLLHGQQEAGTESAKALSALKADGWTGYGKHHGVKAAA